VIYLVCLIPVTAFVMWPARSTPWNRSTRPRSSGRRVSCSPCGVEGQGYGLGTVNGRTGPRPSGSRLPMPWAQETLANFLTPRIREVVRAEVLDLIGGGVLELTLGAAPNHTWGIAQ
jgi:hypothetical protein